MRQKQEQPHKGVQLHSETSTVFPQFSIMLCKVIDPQQEELSAQRLALLKATKIT